LLSFLVADKDVDGRVKPGHDGWRFDREENREDQI
jgi:hypothetical protein